MNKFNVNNFFCKKLQKLIGSVTYNLIHNQVRITEWDLSSCSGKVPKLVAAAAMVRLKSQSVH